jgi:hypothetical protein
MKCANATKFHRKSGGAQRSGETCGFLNQQPEPGCPTSPISCESSWLRELHAPFLKERRTRRRVQGSVQEIRGISLVFREMWDTTAPSLKPLGCSAVTQNPTTA